MACERKCEPRRYFLRYICECDCEGEGVEVEVEAECLFTSACLCFVLPDQLVQDATEISDEQ